MAETVHNWDIEALQQMKSEVQKLRDTLSKNRDILTSEGFEILQSWQGRAGKKMMFVTAANASQIDSLVSRYEELIEQLDNIITKCYIPCEEEIRAMVSQLWSN